MVFSLKVITHLYQKYRSYTHPPKIPFNLVHTKSPLYLNWPPNRSIYSIAARAYHLEIISQLPRLCACRVQNLLLFSPNIFAFINSSFLEQLKDDVCLHILSHQWRTEGIEWPMYAFTIYDIFFVLRLDKEISCLTRGWIYEQTARLLPDVHRRVVCTFSKCGNNVGRITVCGFRLKNIA